MYVNSLSRIQTMDSSKVRQDGHGRSLPDHGLEQRLYGLHTIIFLSLCLTDGLLTSLRDDSVHPYTQMLPLAPAHAIVTGGFRERIAFAQGSRMPANCMITCAAPRAASWEHASSGTLIRNRYPSEPLLFDQNHYPDVLGWTVPPQPPHVPAHRPLTDGQIWMLYGCRDVWNVLKLNTYYCALALVTLVLTLFA